MNKQKASKFRKEISLLRKERMGLEDSVLRRRIMIDACLIERLLRELGKSQVEIRG